MANGETNQNITLNNTGTKTQQSDTDQKSTQTNEDLLDVPGTDLADMVNDVSVVDESGTVDPIEDNDVAKQLSQETPSLNTHALDSSLKEGNKPSLNVDGLRLAMTEDTESELKLPETPKDADNATLKAFEGAQISERAMDNFSPFTKLEKDVYGSTPMTVNTSPTEEIEGLIEETGYDVPEGFLEKRVKATETAAETVAGAAKGVAEAVLTVPEPEDMISEAENELNVSLSENQREKVKNTLESGTGLAGGVSIKNKKTSQVYERVAEKDLDNGVIFRTGDFSIGIPEPAGLGRKQFISVSKKALRELSELADPSDIYNRVRSMIPSDEIAERASKEIADTKDTNRINDLIQGGYNEIRRNLEDTVYTQAGAPDHSFGSLLGKANRPGNKEQRSFAKKIVQDITNNRVDNAHIKLSERLRQDGIPNHEEVARRITDDAFLGTKSNTPNRRVYKNVSGELREIEEHLGKVKTSERQVNNLSRLDITKEQEENLLARLKAIGEDQKEVKTFGDMMEASKKLGANPTKLLQDIVNSRITDDEVTALRNNINTLSQRARDLTNKLDDPTLSRTQQESLKEQLDSVDASLDASLRKLARGNTESGRALAANRIHARNNLDPSFWLNRAVKEMNGRPLTPDKRDAIMDLIDKKDVDGLANFVSMLRRPSNSEKAITLYKAGLLTAPTTHMKNIIGNTGMRALEDIKDVPAYLVDSLISLGTQQRSKTFTPLGKAFAEGEGFKKGAKDAWDYILHGTNESAIFQKYDIPRTVNYDHAILNGYTKGIFRSLGAGDIQFRLPAIRRSLFEQSYLQAKKEGLKGQAFKNRVNEIMMEPDDEMVSTAMNSADYATFMGDNPLNTFIQAGEKAATDVTKGPIGEAIVRGAGALAAPFRRTPTNIANTILDYSPGGAVKAIVKATGGVGANQREISETLGRSITGSGLIYGGYKLAEMGLLTGNAPNNPSEKADFYAQGKQPQSILVNGEYRKISNLSPVGNLLGLGANIRELEKEKKGASLVAGSAGAGVKALSEQTFLKGASGLLKATVQPERNAERYLNQVTGSAVPTLVGRAARLTDPTLKTPPNMWGAIKEKIPGARSTVPTRLNIFGEPATSGEPGIGQVFDPFSSSPKTDDPVLQEAQRVGFTIGMPSKTLSGVKMTEEEYEQYQRWQGQNLRKQLHNLINNKDYQNLPTKKEKREAFNAKRRATREFINDRIFPQLMVKRYNLQDWIDVNNVKALQDFRTILSEVSDSDEFQRANQEGQEKMIKDKIRDVLRK